MKKIFLIFTFTLMLGLTTIYAKNTNREGAWIGTLKVSHQTLNIIVHFNYDNQKWSGTLDSPDQGGFGIPLTTLLLDGQKVNFSCDSIGLTYSGVFLPDNNLQGKMTQGGETLELNFKQVNDPSLLPNKRPQEPKPPFPYITEEIKIPTPDQSVVLAGTFSKPHGPGPFPTMILVTGSGKQTRDEEILGHKPFLVIADYFTKKGFAVYRYDDRGVGQSTGNFKTATTIDFSVDAEAVFNYLKSRNDVDSKKIGIVGHSEGAEIATMVGARRTDLGFVILLGGPATSGNEILLSQKRAILTREGFDGSKLENALKIDQKSYEIIKVDPIDQKALKNTLSQFFTSLPEAEKQAATESAMKELLEPWMTFFIRYNPYHDLQKLQIPTLALYGSLDLQVLPKLNIPLVEQALKTGHHKQYIIKEIHGLNHLFQTATTGLPSEYGKIEETFSPLALLEMENFVRKYITHAK